jgi:hypothetical protein
MDDDILANRIATIAGKNCSVVRFRNEADSEKWLTDKQQVNLIILDKTTGPTMVANVRRKADYQLVPVLVTNRHFRFVVDIGTPVANNVIGSLTDTY